MKKLIFDAGPIISLSMSGQLDVIEKLKSSFDGEFILTPQVKREVVDRPMRVIKYRLEALRVQDLIDRGVFSSSTKFVSDNKLEKETHRVLRTANGCLRAVSDNKKISIIQEGEASCLAFSRLCGSDSVIVVDERTTRLLAESPDNLCSLMEHKLHQKLDLNRGLIGEFSGFRFIRSSELVFVAFEKGLIPLKKTKRILDALLYSLKFKGTAISSDEIETLKGLL